MSFIESTKFHSNIQQNDSFEYNNEPVKLITIFKDINTAIVEDSHGNILDIPADKLFSTSF